MRVLVAGWVGSTNLGDELIFAGLISKLRRLGADVAAISMDPVATTRIHGVPCVDGRHPTSIAAAVGTCDVVAFGGGDLIQDVTSAFNLPYHLGRVALARLRGRRVVGVGLGAPPFQRAGSAALVRRVWPADAPIAVRDHGSAEVLRTAGIEAEVSADLALGLDRPPGGAAVLDNVVAVSLRPWSDGGALPVGLHWQQGFDPQLVTALARNLDRVAERTGLGIRMIAFQTDRDDAFHRAVANHMASDVELVTPTVHTVLTEVSRCRVVVGTRYHASIAALLAGRPAVALAYSRKVEQLAADAGDAVQQVRWGPADADALPDAVQRAVEHSDEVEAAYARLVAREAVNDRVLERVLG